MLVSEYREPSRPASSNLLWKIDFAHQEYSVVNSGRLLQEFPFFRVAVKPFTRIAPSSVHHLQRVWGVYKWISPSDDHLRQSNFWWRPPSWPPPYPTLLYSKPQAK